MGRMKLHRPRSPTLAAILAGVARVVALTLPPWEAAVSQELPCLMLGLVVGPQGFEPWTDGLKVSGSSFKTARKTHENARNCRSQQETAGTNAGLRPPLRYKI